MTLQDAIAADRNGELPLAAACYERMLADGETSLEVLLNLALLYWQATDPGMAAAKKLHSAFLSTAYRRCSELLAEAQQKFPASTEARFWRRYISWADLDEPFDIDECRKLLLEDPAALIPAMRIFSLSDGKEAAAEARELLRQCEKDGTTRARYVASVIESILQSINWRRRLAS